MDQARVDELFSAFVGRKVTTRAKVAHDAGAVIVEIVLNPADPVIGEMEKIAKDNKLSLDFKTQAGDNIVNTGFHHDRITATAIIGKDTRIGSQFKIG